jgi:hypothetical protein
VSSYGTVVRNGSVGMVRGTGVPSGGGVVVMGIVRITTLHPREMTKPELPPPPRLEVVSSSLVDSSRKACSDIDPI